MQIKPPGNFFYVSSILPHTQESNATSVIPLYQLEYRISYNTVELTVNYYYFLTVLYNKIAGLTLKYNKK